MSVGTDPQQPSGESPRAAVTPEEFGRIKELRRLGRRYVGYPSGHRQEEYIAEITRMRDVKETEWTTEYLAEWEDLAKRVLRDINPRVYCGDGRGEVKRARKLLGVPTVAQNLAIGLIIRETELPEGKDFADPGDYIVTITRKDGTVIGAHQVAHFASSYESRIGYRDDFGDARL